MVLKAKIKNKVKSGEDLVPEEGIEPTRALRSTGF